MSVTYFGIFFSPRHATTSSWKHYRLQGNLQTLTTQFTDRLTPGSHSARTPSRLTVEDIDTAAETLSERVRSLSPHFSMQDMTV